MHRSNIEFTRQFEAKIILCEQEHDPAKPKEFSSLVSSPDYLVWWCVVTARPVAESLDKLYKNDSTIILGVMKKTFNWYNIHQRELLT